jgi:soluble lytic murein transglycosylase-like protein
MNIAAGVGYLATLKGSFGDIKKATTAYNQGSSRVRNGTARMWYYNEVYQHYLNMKGWLETNG